MGHRSAASLFGAASRPCKNGDGQVLKFSTREDAESYKKFLTEQLTTTNISYTVETED